MLKTAKKQNKPIIQRIVSSIIILIIVAPIIFFMGYNSFVARLVTFIFIFFSSIYTIFEFTKHLNIHKVTKFLIPLLAAPIFLIDNNFQTITIIKNGAQLNNAKHLLSNILSTYSLFIPLIILTIIILDPVSQRNFESLKTYAYSLFSTILPTVFFKSIFVMTTMSYLFIAVIIPTAIISDVFAYFGGLLLGEKFPKKLAHKISPKKTWVGFWFGYIFSVIYISLMLNFTNIINLTNYKIALIVCLTIFMPLISPLGDLIYSICKRDLNIKDFSNLIPGHGGMLDRIDSWIFVTIIFVLFYCALA